jgi:hypothetical protein
MSGVMRHGYTLSREITTVERRKEPRPQAAPPTIKRSRLPAQSEAALVHQAHGDARPARIDAPPPFQGDGAGLDRVVRCRRLRAIGERRIRAGVVTTRLPQRGWRHHQAEGDRVGLAQREEERLDIAIARHGLGITEVGAYGHEADLPAEKRAAFGTLEVVLQSAPVRRRTSEEPRVIGSEQELLERAHVHLGLFGGQPIVEEGMDQRQQTLGPPGVPARGCLQYAMRLSGCTSANPSSISSMISRR